ncbi:MAG: hypothetical protein IPM82_32855 [Saprospiraceae bacterium]|nr:hypothetical protein [Saprospiraceae bacterium]
MKNTILLCLFACLLGCKPNTSETASESTPGSGAALSAEEQKAMLLSATAMSGEATGVLSADGKALEMTIANSAVFDQESDLLPLHASRAAWVFYKNMGTDKPSFERLDLTAKLKDTTVNLSYKMSDLAIVQARYPAIEKASQMLISRDFEGLYALFDPVVMGASKAADLQGYCTQIEPEYGKPLSFEFRGFAFNKTSAGYDFLSLAGQLKREIKETPLNIAVDLGKPELKGSLNSIKFAY